MDQAHLRPRSPLPCCPCSPGPSPPALSPAGLPVLGTDGASPAPRSNPYCRLRAACAPGCQGLSLPPAGHRQLRCHYPTSRSPVRSPRGDRLAPPLRRQRPHGSHGHGSAAGPLCCSQRGFPLPATSPRTLPKVTAPAARGHRGRADATLTGSPLSFRARCQHWAPATWRCGHLHPPCITAPRATRQPYHLGKAAVPSLSPGEKGRGGAQRALTEI